MDAKLALRFVRAVLVAKVDHNLRQEAIFTSGDLPYHPSPSFGFARSSAHADAAWKKFAGQ